jgi:hypothetical protein
MKVRPLPGVSGESVVSALREAQMKFQNVRGGNHTGIDLFNSYLREANEQVRMLGWILPAADMDRLITTPRYWMLQSVDPAGKLPVLASMIEVELSHKIAVLEEAIKGLGEQRDQYGNADLIVVPDTNVLLHHPLSIENVPWGELAPTGAQRVILAVPVLVVDELDRAKRRGDKIENGKEATRTRARRTLRLLDAGFVSGFSYDVPGTTDPVIQVTLVLDDPNRPRLPDADFEIIDTAMAIRDVTGARVKIASADGGLQFRARAAGMVAEAPLGMGAD